MSQSCSILRAVCCYAAVLPGGRFVSRHSYGAMLSRSCVRGIVLSCCYVAVLLCYYVVVVLLMWCTGVRVICC